VAIGDNCRKSQILKLCRNRDELQVCIVITWYIGARIHSRQNIQLTIIEPNATPHAKA